jgi:3-hydroxyacyl-[acyl-carrier-protein] dehydratase
MTDDTTGTQAEAAATAGAIEMAEILERIPHRYPFLLIDRAEDYTPFASIVGIKCVTANEPFFPGHFPGNPVMPGVLILEALAQSGALLMSKSLNADIEGKAIFLLSLDKVRYRRAVRPGQVLRLQVEVLKHRGDLFKFRGHAVVDAKVSAEAEFAAMVVEQRP